jgi:Putative Ig domain/Fibronectin type III domain
MEWAGKMGLIETGRFNSTLITTFNMGTEMTEATTKNNCIKILSIVSMILVALATVKADAATEFDNDVTIGFVWTAPSGVIDHYRIFVSEEGGAYNFLTTTTQTSFDVTGQNDKTYSLKVSAVNPDGLEGPQSEASNQIVCDTEKPTDPVINTVYQVIDENSAGLTLSTPSSDNHFDAYQVMGGTYSVWTDTTETTEFIFGLLSDRHNTLSVRARDLAGNVSSNNSITINRNPLLSAIGDKSVAENGQLTFAVSAVDSDADQLTLSASNVPAGAGFDPASGIFTWTPDYTQSGQHPVTFTVDDGYGGFDSEQITISVTNDNQPPVLGSISDITVQVGDTVQLAATATDPDNDDVTIAYSGWMTTDTRVTTEDDAGVHTVTVTASDGDLTDSVDITVTVTHSIPGAPGKPIHVD